MLGIIRVLTTEDEKILHEHTAIMDKEFGISLISRCIPDQPNGIYDDATEAVAVPKIEKLAKKMVEEDRVDAITISCAADPAVESCRSLVNVPVFGASHMAIVGVSIGFRTISLIRSLIPTPTNALLARSICFAGTF